MKFTFLFLILFLAISTESVYSQSNKIIGKWLNEEQDAAIEIYAKNNAYFGRIVWLKRGNKLLDVNNSDISKRNEALFLSDILKNFTYKNSSATWENGSIYDPKNGKTYSCKMWLNVNGSLSIRGFIGISLLGRTTTWTQPKEEHPCNQQSY